MSAYKFGFWLLILLALLCAVFVSFTSAEVVEEKPAATFTRCDIEKGVMYCASGSADYWKSQGTKL